MTLRQRWQHYQNLQLAKSTAPIFIGPWRSEVGFEVLYWQPWLAAWRAKYQIPKDRLIAISRGGAGQWYDAGQSVELYDYAPVASVRRAMLAGTIQQGSVKQKRMTDQERALLPAIASDLGIRRYHVYHPSQMYQGLDPWWNLQTSLADVVQQLHFQPLTVGLPPLTLPLPERFLAVSFYHRSTWPLDDDRREWCALLVENLAKVIPIVLLESTQYVDDHHHCPIAGPNITSIAPHVTTQTSLAVQAAVLKKAVGFLGTYGGLMQLAVRLKKPAVGFIARDFYGTSYAHKILTDWVGLQQQTTVFTGRPEDAKFVQEILQIQTLPMSTQASSRVEVPA